MRFTTTLTFLRNEKRQEPIKKINCYYSRRSKFSKDHPDKTEVPDPPVVENLISFKLNDIRKLARLITQ